MFPRSVLIKKDLTMKELRKQLGFNENSKEKDSEIISFIYTIKRPPLGPRIIYPWK